MIFILKHHRCLFQNKTGTRKGLVLLLHPDIQDDVNEFLFYMSKHAIQTNYANGIYRVPKYLKYKEILHICAEKGAPSRHQVRGRCIQDPVCGAMIFYWAQWHFVRWTV